MTRCFADGAFGIARMQVFTHPLWLGLLSAGRALSQKLFRNTNVRGPEECSDRHPLI